MFNIDNFLINKGINIYLKQFKLKPLSMYTK